MRLPKGSQVRIIYSQETGRIQEWLDDQLAMVQLDNSQEELPVEAHDLEPLQSPTTTENNTDIQLVFLTTEEPTAYHFALLNQSNYNLLYELSYQSQSRTTTHFRGLLEKGKGVPLDRFHWDELNDFPIFNIQCWPVLKQGTGLLHKKTLKPKAKKFTGPPEYSQPMAEFGIVFPLFEISPTTSQRPSIDLKEYTQELLEELEREEGPDYFIFDPSPNLGEILAFDNKIDLHLEALVDDPMAIPKEEILATQLEAFEAYLEKAHRLGVEKVYLIHGLGKGVLRKAIHERLLKKGYVRSFKNEYHPSFGYGCTEVDLS